METGTHRHPAPGPARYASACCPSRNCWTPTAPDDPIVRSNRKRNAPANGQAAVRRSVAVHRFRPPGRHRPCRNASVPGKRRRRQHDGGACAAPSRPWGRPENRTCCEATDSAGRRSDASMPFPIDPIDSSNTTSSPSRLDPTCARTTTPRCRSQNPRSTTGDSSCDTSPGRPTTGGQVREQSGGRECCRASPACRASRPGTRSSHWCSPSRRR